MTVLHVVNSIDETQGGPSRSVPSLVESLGRVGVETRLHVSTRDGPLRSAQGIDIVHDHGLWLPSNHHSATVAKRAGLPLVVSARGMLEPWALAFRRWKKRIAWTLYQRSDLATAAVIHATSPAEAEAVRATGVGAPVAVIPNGTDAPDPLPPRDLGPVRRALFLSRVHPKKGLPLLVEAWARVRPEGWELAIAGPDENGHRAHVESLVQQAGLDDAIHFLGPVADAGKWAVYRTASLFVLPTHSENFGLVVAEALAAGVPALTTTGAPWRVLETEACGWWTEPTVDSISDALRQATALSQTALDAMGERGQAYVETSLSWDHVARQMATTYDWLLHQGSRPEFVL